MANNVVANPGSGGSKFATDQDGGGVNWPYAKLAFGADGTQTEVSGANPIPVAAASLPLPTGAAADGVDGTGITAPTGGSGIRGWLSGIYKALIGTLTVSGTISVSGTVPVSGAFYQATQPVSLVSLPALATGANVIGAVTQSGSWTDTVVGSAANGAAVSGNPVLTAGSDGTNARTIKTDVLGGLTPADCSAVINGSQTSASVLFTQDCTGYNSISVQVTSAGTTCTITYEGSNDNTNWLSVEGVANTSTGGLAAATTTAVNAIFPCAMRYFRARVSTYTSGTVTVVAYLKNALAPFAGVVVSGASSTTVSGVASSNVISKTRFVSTAGAPAAQVIKASGGRIYGIVADNSAAYDVFLKIYNTAAASVVVGTTAIIYTIRVKAGTTQQIIFADWGSYFANAAGYSFAITKLVADSDTTAVAAGDLIVQIDYV